MRARPIAAALAAAALAAGALIAAAGPATVTGSQARGGAVAKDLVASGLDQPIYSAAAPGVSDLLYVVLREGTVRALDPSDGSSQEFLDVPAVSTDGEGGLLSIAFDPEYQSNGLLYAYYTTNSSHTIRIDEFEATSDTNADEGSQRRVMAIPHPGAENHQGGTIVFGPDDLLYAAPGDGGNGGDPDESAQDKAELTGKVLRIDPHGAGAGDYTVPAGNPFVGASGRDEVYALGLRNPFRFSFDPVTGKIGIGDVGQHDWEEVDVENEKTLRRANFGWDHFEGNHLLRYPGDDEASRPRRHYEPPVHEYAHADGRRVITGGVFIRDPSLPGLAGRFLYSDFNAGNLRSFEPRLSGARDDSKLGVSIQNPSSFAAGPDGTVYVTSLTTGKLFRIVPEM